MGKKVQVTFSDEQWEIIQKLIGKMGLSASDVVRTIVLSYLAGGAWEMSYFKEATSKPKPEIG